MESVEKLVAKSLMEIKAVLLRPETAVCIPSTATTKKPVGIFGYSAVMTTAQHGRKESK